MKKSLRKLIPAILMVLISASLMGTSTFAWFSMNSKVTTTGMRVHTQVSDDLLIAPDTISGDYSVLSDASLFKTALVQDVKALLEPVSTINGVNFFYNSTKNTSKEGAAIAAQYTAYTPANTADFNTNYGTTDAVGYVDYSFQIKAINTQTYDQELRVTALNIIYGGTDTDENAYRVAIFVNDMGEDGSTNATKLPVAGDMVTILGNASANYFTDDKAVNTTTTLDSVSNLGVAAVLATVDAGKTNYYKITYRLWLEGEDETCNNDTFVDLTGEWALDSTIKLTASSASGFTAIDEFGQDDQAMLTIAVGDAIGSSGTITVAGVTYNPVTDKDLNSKQVYTPTETKVTAASRFFVMDSADGSNYPIEVTNQINLTVELDQTKVTNATSSVSATAVTANKDLIITYEANSGYVLPTTVTVEIGGTEVTDGTEYTWDKATGKLTIGAEYVTDDIEITVTGATPAP